MAMLTETPNSDVLLALLRAKIRSELKGDLMQEAEKLVDSAVDQAIAGLAVHIECLFSQHADRLVKVLVERVTR